MQARAAAPARSPAARPARPRSAAGEDVGQILRLQQTAGNRAVTRMIQRLDAGDVLGYVWDAVKPPILRGPFGFFGGVPAIDLAFDAVVDASRASSRPFAVPAAYFEALEAYASVSPWDGRVLREALKRKPRFHVGGIILKAQPGAQAMTLDRDVFCVGEPSVDTFVHELVHVKQYGDVGPFEFLTDYFGEIGLEELKALLRGEKLDPFEASAFEKEAYALGRRFKRWRESVGR